jgi:hypothetical protein
MNERPFWRTPDAKARAPAHEKSNSVNDSGHALNQRPPAHLPERQLIEF